MRIRNKRDILKFAVLCTLVVSAIVVSVVFLAYPPDLLLHRPPISENL